MNKAIILTFFVLFSNLLFSSNEDTRTPPIKKEFTGTLKYIEYTPFDTTYFTVYITKENIRIDTYNDRENKNIDKVMIYHLNEDKVFAIKPSKEIYKSIGIERKHEYSREGCEVILNKDNFKYINDYKCVQYRIKDKLNDTDVTYWIPEEDFPFYCDLAEMKFSLQATHKYFFLLPNSKVAFPMQSTERSLLREEKFSYKVIEMTETNELNAKLFSIPEGYQLLND